MVEGFGHRSEALVALLRLVYIRFRTSFEVRLVVFEAAAEAVTPQAT